MLNFLLSTFGIPQKVKQSLTPERQKLKPFPASYNIDFEDIAFQTNDGLSLKAWWIAGSSDITIILSHSFAANRSGWEGKDANNNSYKIDWLPSIKALVDYGYNVLAFDHRACGESEGDLSYFGKSEALDIVAAVDWVKTNKSGLNKFGIVGFSSGANATLRAIEHLEQDNSIELAGILVSIYWYKRMIAKSTRFFTKLPSIMIPAIKKATTTVVGFDPVKEINPSNILPKIKAPLLLVNAEFDEIGSVADIRDIYKKRVDYSSMLILKNEKRFDAYHFIEKHPEQVKDFFDKSFSSRLSEAANENSAIIVIEFQKSWTEKGIFNKIIKKELNERNVLANTKKLLDSARKKNIKIIQAPLILDKSAKTYNKTPLPARLLKQFTKGTWKAEFSDGIHDSSDTVITGRYGFDATEGSNLESILKENKITKTYVCGFTTDHCVKDTMNSLIEKGYKSTMVSDCTAARSNKLQQKIESEFSTVSSEELIKRLKNGSIMVAKRV